MRILMSFQYLSAMPLNVLQQACNIKKAAAYAAQRRPIQLTVQFIHTHKDTCEYTNKAWPLTHSWSS